MSARNQVVNSFALIRSRIGRNILYNPVFDQAATELQHKNQYSRRQRIHE